MNGGYAMLEEKKIFRSFTLLELLIVISIIAILAAVIIPNFIGFDVEAKLVATKTNLNTTKAQLRELGDSKYPPLKEQPLVMNKAKLRIKREIIKESDPLEVRVEVFYEGQTDKPIITLVTLIEDMTWK